jgi:hydroxymethylglutaryl-CoA lyase
VANTRGAVEASRYDSLTYLGFPLSISETFQRRNTNKSIPEALNTLEEIKNICGKTGKKLVTYISMGFGNPYGDPYSADLVSQFVDILITLGSDVISLADTIGAADSVAIESLFSSIFRQPPPAEIGAHLHSVPSMSRTKIEAAYRGGCRRFDGALRGFGGCPMAKDELVGNIATEVMVSFFEEEGVTLSIDKRNFTQALVLADQVFHPVK